MGDGFEKSDTDLEVTILKSFSKMSVENGLVTFTSYICFNIDDFIGQKIVTKITSEIGSKKSAETGRRGPRPLFLQCMYVPFIRNRV